MWHSQPYASTKHSTPEVTQHLYACICQRLRLVEHSRFLSAFGRRLYNLHWNYEWDRTGCLGEQLNGPVNPLVLGPPLVRVAPLSLSVCFASSPLNLGLEIVTSLDLGFVSVCQLPFAGNA